jgi:2-dehydropantoate 2-reductase
VRLCVAGAGAVGALLAARLTRGGVATALLARGAALDAIRRDGITVTDRSGTWQARPAAVGTAADLGPQDFVVAAVKAWQLPALAESLAPALLPHTTVVTAVNGIPWWYFHGHPARGGECGLEEADPGGRIWRALGPRRALGCVVTLGAEQQAPGRVRHAWGAQVAVGEPSGGASERVDQLASLLEAGGLKVIRSAQVRTDLWRKLLFNLGINPVSLLVGAGVDRILAGEGLRGLLERMVEEGLRVAHADGVDVQADPQEQVSGLAGLGGFRTSMLQDLEARRPTELEAIVGAVVALAQRHGVAVPTLSDVLALARARVAGQAIQEQEAT